MSHIEPSGSSAAPRDSTVRIVKLTDAELVMLDLQCRPETQALVEEAKERMAMVEAHADLPAPLASFIARVVAEARTEGRLVFYFTSIERCELCGRVGGYAPYKRSSPTHRKGDPDYSRPRRFQGVELAKRFIGMSGHVTLGGCSPCFEKVKGALATALSTVPAEVPEQITGMPPRFHRFENVKCSRCDWTGHEGLMGRQRTIMGDGTYPSDCPNCKAQNNPFGARIILPTEGFTICEAVA